MFKKWMLQKKKQPLSDDCFLIHETKSNRLPKETDIFCKFLFSKKKMANFWTFEEILAFIWS